MSDLIRREDVLRIIRNGWSNHYSRKDMCDEINELPTVDEKEIIRKPMERIIERLEEESELYLVVGKKDCAFAIRQDKALRIVKEEGGIEC